MVTRAQRLVEGLVLPVTLAGHPVLEFCNTRAGWNAGIAREYLVDYDHLVVWAGAVGLVSPAAAQRLRRAAARDRRGAEHVLTRALRLRTAIYGACTDANSASAWEGVAAEAHKAAAAAVFVSDAPPDRRWVVSEQRGLDLPVLAIAHAAAAFLDRVDPRAIGRCPGEGCAWLFLDERGRRRWCDMAVCGNRAKQRRHVERTRRTRVTER